MRFFKYVVDPTKCVKCGFCETIVKCPSPERCIGCEACYLACPYYARIPVEDKSERRYIKIKVDGVEYEVPEYITVKKALEILGYVFTRYPEPGKMFAPCNTGGCYACAVLVDGELKPACHTPVREGMEICTNVEGITPLRIVEGFSPHPVGGVGTPYWLKYEGKYIEVAAFAAGCNLRCPTCQNYHVTYNSSLSPLTPEEAARILTSYRRRYGVHRMAISGGEPTINRRWLVQFFKELRKLNRDEKARFHLDTNATILTKDYIDELIEDTGITDIGPDIKALKLETFQLITNITDKELAEKYLKTEWEAVRYIADNYYPDKVFMGIGIPYNREFHPTFDEIYKMGLEIAKIDPDIQVCVLDYRGEFRKWNMPRPTVDDMLMVKEVLENAGLKKVIVQTSIGHIGP